MTESYKMRFYAPSVSTCEDYFYYPEEKTSTLFFSEFPPSIFYDLLISIKIRYTVYSFSSYAISIEPEIIKL